jgi:hypothetical protein
MNRKAEMMTAWNVGYHWEFEEFEDVKPIIEVFNFDGEEIVFRHKKEIEDLLQIENISRDRVQVECYIWTSGCYRIEMCFSFDDIKENEFRYMIDLLQKYGLPEYPVGHAKVGK